PPKRGRSARSCAPGGGREGRGNVVPRAREVSRPKWPAVARPSSPHCDPHPIPAPFRGREEKAARSSPRMKRNETPPAPYSVLWRARTECRSPQRATERRMTSTAGNGGGAAVVIASAMSPAEKFMGAPAGGPMAGLLFLVIRDRPPAALLGE